MTIARVVLFLSSTAAIIVPILDSVNYFQAVNVKTRTVITPQHDTVVITTRGRKNVMKII